LKIQNRKSTIALAGTKGQYQLKSHFSAPKLPFSRKYALTLWTFLPNLADFALDADRANVIQIKIGKVGGFLRSIRGFSVGARGPSPARREGNGVSHPVDKINSRPPESYASETSLYLNKLRVVLEGRRQFQIAKRMSWADMSIGCGKGEDCYRSFPFYYYLYRRHVCLEN
jgi:hypothetical protein